jgi:hypothetical protein
MGARTCVVLARDRRVEGTEYPGRVVAIDPEVPVEVRHEHVRLKYADEMPFEIAESHALW